MAVNRSILSAGLLIRDILTSDDDVMELVTNVFPVVSVTDATLPYIAYGRSGLTDTAIKNRPGAKSAIMEILIYAATYGESISIAEAVANALDEHQAQYTDDRGNTLTARSIRLTDAVESFADDAYLQTLSFTINV